MPDSSRKRKDKSLVDYFESRGWAFGGTRTHTSAPALLQVTMRVMDAFSFTGITRSLCHLLTEAEMAILWLDT